MEKVLLKVEGMDCAACAQTITRTLSKEGLNDIHVDFMTGEVTFEEVKQEAVSIAVTSINKLGYNVKSRSDLKTTIAEKPHITHAEGSQWKFIIALVFTIPLVAHMFLPFHFLHEPVVQL